MKNPFQVVLVLWLFSVVGNFCSSITLAYIGMSMYKFFRFTLCIKQLVTYIYLFVRFVFLNFRYVFTVHHDRNHCLGHNTCIVQ
jgi:hypothetical protein